jgi:AraC family transcriptional regulator
MRGMGIERDVFLGFIDDLAADLDDHESTADERAARHCLSRSHFDRLISATAGETPAAFRRRILLERAAFRLATSPAGVLQLAVEADYSSNEAFTRAFGRAYGVTPSAWRERPGQIQIASPNDVHFHPPGGLRLPGNPEETTMNLIVRMVEHHLWLVGEMVEKAAKVDDAALDRPIELSVEQLDDKPTMRKLLSRLVGQMDMWQNVINGRDYDMGIEAHESVAEMRARLAIAGPAFLAEVRRVVDGGRLDETFIDACGDQPEVFTYGGLIAHVLTFAAHRRLLVLGALETAGIADLGTGDPRRWVETAA